MPPRIKMASRGLCFCLFVVTFGAGSLGVCVHSQEPSAYGTLGSVHSAQPVYDLGAEHPVSGRESFCVESWRPFPAGYSIWPEAHNQPNDPYRHVGVGDPLLGTSWLNRPFYAGWLVGALWGSTLIRDELRQDEDLFGGYRLGWDFDHYWGSEIRFAFAHLDLIDADGRVNRTASNAFWDLSLLYYPWGDATWRPFASIGLGLAAVEFEDARQQVFDEAALEIPFGCGVKYYHKPWLALRTSVMDNFVVGSGALASMHSVSWTAGVEVHFGGPRRSYFPYHPGGIIW